MYNHKYEVDVRADVHGTQYAFRVALCAQLWQKRGEPQVLYQSMWLASASVQGGRRSGPFRLSQDYDYRGHFPCELYSRTSEE